MGSKLATLEQNWRRVASTHTLQDLLNADKTPEDKGPSIKIIFYGVGLILAGIACLTLGIVAFGARWIFSESSTDPVIQFLREDRYYHLLVPALVPVTIVAIFINWFSMKLFRHNS